jgi:hypothetical protein
MSNEIHVSDYQLRHSQRSEKSVPLSLEDLKLLPSKLEIASWFYDSSHNNLIATFDILSEMENDIGKVAIKINFAKKEKANQQLYCNVWRNRSVYFENENLQRNER